MMNPTGRYQVLLGGAALVAMVLLSARVAVSDDGNQALRYWPQWRGPLSTGVAPRGNPPTNWGETKNIRWKTPLPGSGHSTPIVWGDYVFVTAAVPYGEHKPPRSHEVDGAHGNRPVTRASKFVVIAVNRRDGKIRWQKTMRAELPHEDAHYTGTMASNSPVTDGERVFAFFGSRGLYCLDFKGEKKWARDLGKMRIKHAHGEGSSPALYGNTVIVNWDHSGQSFIAAFDKRTGKRLWKTKRPEVTSWATPIVVKVDGKPQVIVSGTRRMRGYGLSDGKVIWQCAGLSANIVASPVSSDGVVYAGSSYVKQGMLAIRLTGAKGDITGSDHVIWNRRRNTPYVPSPLLYGKSLYFLHHYQPVMSRLDAKTGKDPEGPYRLPAIRNVYASPVGAANRVYITDRTGMTLVLSHDKKLKILATNRLDESINASGAIVGGEIFLRGDQHLYCIAEQPEKKTPATSPSKP